MLWSGPALAGPPELQEPSYDLGQLTVAEMSRDLHAGLEAPLKSRFDPLWLAFEGGTQPSIQFAGPAGVKLSSGFVEAIQRLAHALAINRVERGYFQRYLKLMDRSGSEMPGALPNADRPDFWGAEVVNARITAANAMLAVAASMHLCEISLGYLDKYKSRVALTNSETLPSVTAFLAPDEWQQVLEQGVRVALHAGWAFDVVEPLFEAVDKMKNRPAWISAIVPSTVKFSRVKRRLQEIQDEFLKE